MPDFLLPDLGEGLTEAEVLTWMVRVGDTVRVDQPVVEVETAKAAVEVPVPFAGTVTALHAPPGTVVRVGAPLITVEPVEGLQEPGVVSGNVLIGYGTTTETRRNRRGPRRAQTVPHGGGSVPHGDGSVPHGGGSVPHGDGSVPHGDGSVPHGVGPVPHGVGPVPHGGGSVPHGVGPVPHGDGSVPHGVGPVPHGVGSVPHGDGSVPHGVGPVPHGVGPVPHGGGPVRVISPLVRRIAREGGLDLRTVVGTGPEGLIRRADVEKALVPTEPGETRIPLKGVRGAVAEKLSRSRREIPEATVWVDVDATEFLAARAALNAAAPERPVSLLALLSRFALLGLARHPELNARVERDEIVIPQHVHLGFAAQTDRGLVVPVVRDAHRMPTRALSAAIAERTAAARAGTLAPAALTGGTFTVNNYGVFGVDGSAAIINHPEVAILGIGRIIDRPWVVGGELTVRKVSQLTLAFDHRACDGGAAGGFLRYIADCVESPLTALGEL
ncbi:dihydrolipoamide acetyltransferase family protein [Dactylosporangium sp. McL0621]|uniref:dihydrolipoamide acetyltransferase family protein n=1 Tax=Dactylosporangium sp. McL0621 TaxID=3415678 RepID=UPI003CEE5DD3